MRKRTSKHKESVQDYTRRLQAEVIEALLANWQQRGITFTVFDLMTWASYQYRLKYGGTMTRDDLDDYLKRKSIGDTNERD